jgi:hypothetical protein
MRGRARAAAAAVTVIGGIGFSQAAEDARMRTSALPSARVLSVFYSCHGPTSPDDVLYSGDAQGSMGMLPPAKSGIGPSAEIAGGYWSGSRHCRASITLDNPLWYPVGLLYKAQSRGHESMPDLSDLSHRTWDSKRDVQCEGREKKAGDFLHYYGTSVF